MNSLIALCADYYWEQDVCGRFTLLQSTGTRSSFGEDMFGQAMGKAAWEIADIAPGGTPWDAIQDIFASRMPFRDAEWSWRVGPAGTLLLSVSGEPMFDRHGAFAGYRGIMRDITAQWRNEKALRRFRAAFDISGDPVLLIDRATMRIIDVNETACRAFGYTRNELLDMGPQDFLMADRQTIERDFDHVITAGRLGMMYETEVRGKDGAIQMFELHRQAISFEGRWVIVTAARDVTRRKQAEEAAVRLGQMYAALSGTNEAILHAQNPDTLFRKVCNVTARGPIVTAAVLLKEPESDRAKVAAVSGVGMDSLHSVLISFDEDRPEGHGLVGTAFRSRKVCVINDFAADTRMQPWREVLGIERGASGAAIPLIRNGESVGVLLLYSRDKNAFDDEIVQLLERIALDIVFALENFDLDAERRKAVDALRESEEKYRSILENMNDAYFEVDLKGTYTAVNDALCRLHRCTKEEALQFNYRQFTDAATAAELFKTFNQVYRTGQPMDLAEYKVRRRNGEKGIAQTSIQLIVDADGTPTGFRGITRDVTALRQAADALSASEEKYRSILSNIEEAYYEVDLTGTLLMCNEAFCRMFGYSMNEPIGLNYAQGHSPDEASHIFANFNQVYRTGKPKMGIDWRLKHKDGNVVLCEGSIHLVRDANGQPAGFRGIMRDVTARREMENALRESEERFRDLTELSSDWYWEQDENYRFVQISGDVLAKTGMAAEDYLGKTLWELPFGNVTKDQWHEHCSRLADGKPFYEFVLKTSAQEGALRYLSISGLPVTDARGRLLGYRGTGKDITERMVAEERIRHLASHDILTGLPNRMMFNQVLSYQVQQAQRYERKFAVMFIDLDHFKAINDNFGHGAGDLLLKETARRLTESVRASDFVARLAGDEFVVIIQELGDMEQLRAVAQKIVSALRAPLMLAGAVHHVTASVGVCVFPDDGQDEEALLRHADAAMYQVKRSTKNSFQFYLGDS